jgi:cytochrome c-type biogenesis protein CcmH
MTLWFAVVFGLMTAAAIFAVLWPLGQRAATPGGTDLAVYRDQLDEIVRDRAAGLIGEAEAEAAKVEVSRRLIAAADVADAAEAVTAPASGRSTLWRRRLTALAGLILVPVGATLLYSQLGSPQMPGEPLAARLRAVHQDRSIQGLIAQVEEHLERHPDDARGYEVVAPVYLRMGRFDDAVRARRKILQIAGETADRQADLGEALAAANNGVITVDAKTAFERALELDPNDLKARFFIGVAAEQDGDRHKAAAIWTAMLKGAPAGAPWVPMVSAALTRVGGTPPAVTSAPATAMPGPSAADVAAASGMSQQDRGAMINGMVAQLAAKLKQDGSDAAGWVRLVRSYRVLGENEKAQAAIADAQRALAGDPNKLRVFAEGTGAGAPVASAPENSGPAASAPAAAAPGPSAADVAAASSMSEQDRNAMIHTMVARLADKLKVNGGDLAGWQRLLRAYMVLGERDKAKSAAGDARKALASDPDKLRQIGDTIKSMGLEG